MSLAVLNAVWMEFLKTMHILNTDVNRSKEVIRKALENVQLVEWCTHTPSLIFLYYFIFLTILFRPLCTFSYFVLPLFLLPFNPSVVLPQYLLLSFLFFHLLSSFPSSFLHPSVRPSVYLSAIPYHPVSFFPTAMLMFCLVLCLAVQCRLC